VRRRIFAGLGVAIVVALGCATSEVPSGPAPARATAVVEDGVASPDPEPVAATPEARAISEEPSAPDVVASRVFFAGRDEVTVEELVAEIDALADEAATSPAVADDWAQLVEDAGLVDSPELYRDYVRLKLAFEATRDGGWWNLSWKITNEKPNSEQIWRQWKAAVPAAPDRPTAFAECDELSALFAFLVRRLSVRGVGLYWPTWNHVVAVWTVPGVQTRGGSPVRIVVPTSQIFLTEDDSVGTHGFDPWSQKKIYEYRRQDVKGSHPISAELARFFLEQIAAHGHKSQAQLQDERNERDARLMSVAL
jgi:hypothetical protein